MLEIWDFIIVIGRTFQSIKEYEKLILCKGRIQKTSFALLFSAALEG
jgi:hypothetical protein